MSSEPKTATNEEVPFQVNQKKLKELAERSEAVKIGGKVSRNFEGQKTKDKAFLHGLS